MKTNDNFDEITLPELAHMVASGFEQVDKRLEQVDRRLEQVDKRFEQTASKDDLEALAQTVAKGFEQTVTKADLDVLRKESHERLDTLEKLSDAGFQSIHNAFEKFIQAVRADTNGVARRVKRLEEAVFGVGK